MPNPNSYDIETCTWCRGSGINESFNGKPNPPACVRCLGSGKIYVTDKMATTKRRRKYTGPVPKETEETIVQGPSYSEMYIKPPEYHEIKQPKKRGRPPKVASGNNPT